MAENSCSLKEAANALDIGWTPKECEIIYKRKEFQSLLRQAKYKFYSEVSNTPTANKSAALGMAWFAVEQLLLAGEYDKVISAVEKIGKLAGWIGAESNINVFAGLTAKDIEIQREKLLAQIESSRPSGIA